MEAWRRLQADYPVLQGLDKETFLGSNGLYDVISAYLASLDKGRSVDRSELRRWIDNPSIARTRQRPPSTPNTDGASVATIVTTVLVLGVLLGGLYYLGRNLFGGQDTGEAASQYQTVRDDFDLGSCIRKAVDSCESACEKDPTTTYCGIMFMDGVVGSGCTQDMKSRQYGAQVERCKATACEKMEDQAWEGCYSQMKR